MSIRIFVLIAFFVSFIPTVLAESNPVSEQQLKIQIAALFPLTGGAAEQGEWGQRGLELARDEINQTSRLQIEIAYEDTRGDSKQAVTAYKSLKVRKPFPVVFTWGSGVGVALTPLVNRDRVIQMGVATGTPVYSTAGDFTFRNYPSAVREAERAAQLLYHKLKARKILILQIENDYGSGFASAFHKHFLSYGGRIIKWETFLPNEPDYRSQLMKLRKLVPDYVYLATYPSEGGLILRQAREFGLNWKFIATPAITGGRHFRKLAGESAEGLIIVSAAPLFNNTTQPNLLKFIQQYRLRFGEPPDLGHYIAVLAYDALKILEPIFISCGSDTICIKNALFKVKDYPGIGGAVSFDQNGDVPGHFSVQVYRQGKYVDFFGGQ
jgi:branched-chain amino acid transport system substrate-binding protein